MIQVFKPSLGEEEIEGLREIFKTGWIGLGPKTTEFEEKFAAFVGAKYAVGVNSATAALHLACLGIGIGPGDEVLVPTMTFVSTAHAPAYCGAIPVFVDIEPDTLNISVEDILHKITPRTKAIIPVHYGGYACRMEEIWEIAEKNNLFVIEDAAHACGSSYKGQRIGGLERSDVTTFSFHAVKNLATGDGGMITTNHIEVVRALKQLRWVGIDKSTWDRTEEATLELESGIRRYASYGWYYEVHELGYKYHMNDITAVIGLAQLGKLEKANARRREIVERYNRAFDGVEWIECPVEKEYTRSALHNYVIKTPYRDKLNLYLKDKGIATGVHYMPIHLQPYYRKQVQVTLPIAEKVWTQLLTLPLYPGLTDNEVDYVIESILSLPMDKKV
jgi:perosamine synthetase